MKMATNVFVFLIFFSAHAFAQGNCVKEIEAASAGAVNAQFKLGLKYAKGECGVKNPQKAAEWYEKAAAQGDNRALVNLGYMYIFGDIGKDEPKAFKLFSKAASSGDSKGMAALGQMYEAGEGVPQDWEKAVEWYAKAASKGDSHAQARLGSAYAKGNGVAQNDKLAVKWFAEAAKQGDVKAQRNLGLMYELGRGVPQDDKKAVKWYTEAAEKGFAKAQFNLGRMYEQGKGCAKTLKEAKIWYTRAALQGYTVAQNWLEKLESSSQNEAQGGEVFYTDVEGPFEWDASQDFSAGYFDTFYENGLIYALPSAFANSLEAATDWEYRRTSSKNRAILDNYILMNMNDYNTLYKKGAVVGKVSDVSIDGVKGWRLPTFDEVAKSKVAERWQKSLEKPVRNGMADAYCPPVATHDRKSKDVVGHRLKRNQKYWNREKYYDGLSSYYIPAILVREPSSVEKEILGVHGQTPEERIIHCANLLTQKALIPRKEEVKKYKKEEYPPAPAPIKGEFEKSIDFKARESVLREKWEQEKLAIDSRNQDSEDVYLSAVEVSERNYMQQKLLFADSDYQKGVYKKMREGAIRIVLGKPYFKDMKYNADAEVMNGLIFSARYPKFEKNVSFSVPISDARKFKEKLLTRKLIPIVTFDNHFAVASAEAVTDDQKIAFDYEVAQKLNTIKSYEYFIEKNPSSPQAALAYARMTRLAYAVAAKIDTVESFAHFLQTYPRAQERDLAQKKHAGLVAKRRLAKAEYEREKAERKKQKKEAEIAAYKAHMADKKVGDTVCVSATAGLGLVKYTITATVERISGSKMQLRILSTESQVPYYKGRNIYPGTLLWDEKTNWRLCND